MAENLLDNAKAQQANIILPTGKAAEDARVLWQMLLTQGLANKLSSFFSKKAVQYRKPEKRQAADERSDKMHLFSRAVSELSKIFNLIARKNGEEYERALEHEMEHQNDIHRDRNIPDYMDSYLTQGYFLSNPDPRFGHYTSWASTKELMSDFDAEGVDPYTFDFLGNTALTDAPDYDPSFLFKTEDRDKYSPIESGKILFNANKIMDFRPEAYPYAAIERYLNDPHYNGYRVDNPYYDSSKFLDDNRDAIPFFNRRLAQVFNKAYNDRIRMLLPLADEHSMNVSIDPISALEGPFMHIAPEIVNGLINGDLYKSEFDEKPISEYNNRFGNVYARIVRKPFTTSDYDRLMNVILPRVGDVD